MGSPSKLLSGQELEKLSPFSWGPSGERAGGERRLGLCRGERRAQDGSVKVPWVALGPCRDPMGSA